MPDATSTSESQKVAYSPIILMEKIATSEPSVGRPPVKASQNQPVAEPRISSGAADWIQTKNA